MIDPKHWGHSVLCFKTINSVKNKFILVLIQYFSAMLQFLNIKKNLCPIWIKDNFKEKHIKKDRNVQIFFVNNRLDHDMVQTLTRIWQLFGFLLAILGAVLLPCGFPSKPRNEIKRPGKHFDTCNRSHHPRTRPCYSGAVRKPRERI